MLSTSLTAQLLAISVLSLQRQIEHNKLASASTWNSTYDFIVIGAGGAGAIVAARLAENSSVRVLLLEAGGQQSVITDIPADYYELVGNPLIDWNYPMASQPQLGQAYTMPVRMSVGKVLGGSTVLSGMVYNRGNRRNFDQWETVYGCRGWNYDQVLPYFLRAENETDPNYRTVYHGTKGPITVSSDWSRLNQLPVFKDYLRTAQSAGYPIIDPNGATQNGVTLFQHTIAKGAKVTSTSAYLRSPRPNLDVLSKSFVTKILFNGTTAIGVNFTRGGQSHLVMANREVIVSAGTISSAQLLLLSGVGPRDPLTALGIPVVADLAVGENLHDHSNTILYFDVPDQSHSYEPVDLSVGNLYNYYKNAEGPLVMFPNAATYISSSVNNDTEWPDIMTEMVRSNNHWNNLSSIASQYRTRVAEWEQYWSPYVGRRLLSFDVQMVRPRARGNLSLASTNPFDPPIIDPNYLGHPDDLRALVSGIRQVLGKITNQGPFSKTARFISKPVPGCSECADGSLLCDQYITCFVRQTSVPVYRQAGTCRCGSHTDRLAVVDERLRVFNVTGLRVVDSSIMPQVINANSWPATAMIAEYGSHMIRQDNRI